MTRVAGVLSDQVHHFKPFSFAVTTIMQAHEELDPTVRIRDLKKDRVNFVLENVDLAYVFIQPCTDPGSNILELGSQIRCGE